MSHDVLSRSLDRIKACLEQGAPVAGEEFCPPGLQTLMGQLGLGPFERDLLLLCLGVELDPSFAGLCARAQSDEQAPWPTFQLALSILPNANWTAILQDSPLRRFHLIEVGSGAAVMRSPLALPERVTHFLCGMQSLDESLLTLVEPLLAPKDAGQSRLQLAHQMAGMFRASEGHRPVYQLYGGDVSDRAMVAAAAVALAQASGFQLVLDRLSATPGDITAMIRSWQREVLLAGRILFVESDGSHGIGEVDERNRERLINRLIDEVRGPLILAGRERRPARLRPVVHLPVNTPSMREQLELWRECLCDRAETMEEELRALVSQFNLGETTIRAAVATLGESDSSDGGRLWEYCRLQTRPRFNTLAESIVPKAKLKDLVLPELQKNTLLSIVEQVRLRSKVYDDWGFMDKSGRGLGISVLFHGPSGTGKTMAAELLAGQLGLNLFRIDLSSVISKYIGETEKNLSAIFNAAEGGGAVLLFDEADALFGKRSEVRDSHDRHANIEVAYLLQRIEAFRGLAILTSNLKENIDQAFLRRIRFVVRFPFPDATQRAEIWRRIFPEQTPVDDLDYGKLGRLKVAGGNIRNIALNAAFLAAGEKLPVGMGHIIQAAEGEYVKLERVLLEFDD